MKDNDTKVLEEAYGEIRKPKPMSWATIPSVAEEDEMLKDIDMAVDMSINALKKLTIDRDVAGEGKALASITPHIEELIKYIEVHREDINEYLLGA